MTRQLCNLIIILLATGVNLMACGPSTVSTAGSPDAPIVLRVATGDSGNGLTPHQEIIARFEAENPDIKIEIESVAGQDYYGVLLTNIVAGESPDIMQIGDDALSQFVAKNALLPLDSFMAGPYPLEASIYLPHVFEPGQWDGTTYLLPKDFSPVAVYYNKILFDTYNVPYPQPGWTWADLLSTAQALTHDTDGDGRTDVWGVQLPASWVAGFEYWVVANHGQLISDDGQTAVGYFDAPEVVEAIQFYADLYNIHQVAPLPEDLNSFGGGNRQFVEGKAAMYIFGHWLYRDFNDNPAIELGVAPPPGQAQANVLVWSGFGISQSSQHQEAAWRFLRFYAGEQGATVWQEWGLPAVEDVAVEYGLFANPLEQVWFNQLDYVVPRAFSRQPRWGDVGQPALRRLLEQAIIDPDMDVAASLEKAAFEMQNQLAH